VRTRKEGERARDTHFLGSAEQRTVEDKKRASELGTLTAWRAQSKIQLRTRKEGERASGSHFLESAERGTIEHMGRRRVSEEDSLSRERKARDK
jgi:hypothetical protein